MTRCKHLFITPLLLCTAALSGQVTPTASTLPVGTQLPVRIPNHLPLKVGQPVRAELLYPVYADNKVVIPARTVVLGSVVSLTPDHKRRVDARLRADFTPFHNPVVQFTSIVPPDGPPIPITTDVATNGTPVYRLLATPQPQGGISGFVRQYIGFAIQHVKDTLAIFTAPDPADRFGQFIVNQLPYHPQRISANTSWTLETSAPLTLSAVTAPPPAPARKNDPAIARSSPLAAPTEAQKDAPPTWIIEAYLNDPISSETSHAEQVIHATVAQPVLNSDGSIAVPQGAVLSGTVAEAHPSRSFARVGVLRFTFRQLTLPGQSPQSVRATLTGADSAQDSGQNAELALTPEGQVKPKAQDKLIIPALLVFLALRPLDHEHFNRAGHRLRADGAASNSLGLIGFIVGTAARQPNFAAGLGFYGVALSLYPRFIGKGQSVAFAKNTRIILETTATRSVAMKRATPPQAAPPQAAPQ